jgi:dTDP-4-amino-4,6-dideoxygalactose transaminase
LATFAGRKVGGFGTAATFSFYPGKNLGAYGDAGAIVTASQELADRCRRYANHGALIKHQHEVEGVNSRLDGLQAAILSAKLPYLQQWTAQRSALADRYDALLSGVRGIEVPRRRPQTSHVFHLYVVLAERREELREHLKERGIECQVHYPTALPFQPAYARLGGTAAQFPRAHRQQHQILSLPMYAELESAQLEHVCKEIAAFYAGSRA